MSPSDLPLALTPGEPGGVGAEIAVKCWHRRSEGLPAFFLLDDPQRVIARTRRSNLTVEVIEISDPQEAKDAFQSGLPILPLNFATEDRPGELHPDNAPAVIAAIEQAVSLVTAGRAGAIVTNPIQKETLYSAGFTHPGHTEFLGHLADGNPMPVMMLAAEGLRVVPATIHIPISAVPETLTSALLVKIGRIVAEALRQDFAIAEPRLAIAGLNPHAGENGTIGLEDRDIVAPAVEALKNDGILARGPLPGDTMFHAAARDTYDAAICMFHDQALIPIKTIDFWGGVNVTLGLPFVRTSPDHGTALELAGTGTANEESLFNALMMAHQMATARSKGQERG